MTDQQEVRRILQELVKREDLKNKACADCGNPNPQWASLSFATFLCLQCAGVHRGFGVHISLMESKIPKVQSVSFVRSISMDTWQDEQVRRMQLGGNLPFKEFMQSYTPADQGGYKEGSSAYDTYHCWAAAQYREKLDAALADKPWSPSAPPADFAVQGNGSGSPGRPSSAQGLRKSRASNRSATGSSLRGDTPSPASFSKPSPRDSPLPDAKAANEAFFASLGQANANRPADLPPSRGGRYQGFGSTPTPPLSEEHPSFGLSSAAAPTLSDIQENPMAALGKGWSLLSRAVIGASRVVSENVIQPGMEKVMDPELHATVKGYASEAQKRAIIAGQTANHWSKNQLGVDVAEQVGGVVGAVKDKIGGGPAKDGYGAVATEHDGETSALYHDDEDEFFDDFTGGANGSIAKAPATASASSAKKDDWDEWKDF